MFVNVVIKRGHLEKMERKIYASESRYLNKDGRRVDDCFVPLSRKFWKIFCSVTIDKPKYMFIGFFCAGHRSQLSDSEVYSRKMCAESPQENGEQTREKIVSFVKTISVFLYQYCIGYIAVLLL